MKKRTTFIGVAFLTAILMLSVGYAAITNVNLDVKATANAEGTDANFSVKFNQKTSTTKTNNSSTVTATADNLTANLDVTGLTTKGDTATATYTIDNLSSELGTTLELGTLNNDNQTYFEVTQELAQTNVVAGGNTTLTITVKLIKTPVGPQKASISTSITASPKEA